MAREKECEKFREASKSVRTVARAELRERDNRNFGRETRTRVAQLGRYPHPFVSSGTANEGGEGVESL
jgi:hypothetical protein